MFGLLKRFRDTIVVAALLLVPLAVYFAQVKRPSERSAVDRFVIALTAPVERGVAWAVTGALDAWRGYVALRGVGERARELSHQVTVLELERLEKEKLRAENARLRRLLEFSDAEPDLEIVGARVIGVRLDPKGLQLVTVDRGADAGLARMMPVIVAEGVVGRVHSVTPRSADVLLLVDRNSSVAARVERSRARANVRGTGDPYACRLDYALRSDDLVDGDVLVTSGTDGVFPRGLPVGRVQALKKQGQGLYQKADVAPAVDVTKLEEVLVVTAGGLRAPEPAPAPEPVAGVKLPPRTPGPDAPPALAAPAAKPPGAMPAAAPARPPAATKPPGPGAAKPPLAPRTAQARP